MSDYVRIPSYCRHRGTGQAYVVLSGKTIYLGKYGTAESKAEYHRQVGEWQTAGCNLPSSADDRSVNEIILAYLPVFVFCWG